MTPKKTKKSKKSKSKKEKKEKKSKKEKRDNSRSHSRSRTRSRSRSRHRSKSNEDRKYRKVEHYRHDDHYHDRRKRDNDHHRKTSSSPSQRRSPDKISHTRIKIDKNKLLEIAKANVLKTAIELQSKETSDGKMNDLSSSLKTKSIDELVEYCKKLAKTNECGEDNKKLVETTTHDDTKVHHPFEVKEATNDFKRTTSFQIPSSQPIKELTSQFPVSSGTQHRNKVDEIDIAVVPKEESKIDVSNMQLMTYSNSEQSNLSILKKEPEIEIDVSSLITKRLDAVKRINIDSNDYDAYRIMNEIDEKLKEWSNSKQTPGQFTGSTDVKLLSQQELEGNFSVWARKDLLSSAMPITQGIGKKLLEKMGWKEGEGLGKKKEGVLNPLALDVKMDRKGLVSYDEKVPSKTSEIVSTDGKHPVSVLIELCKQRRWRAPDFDLVSESGPPHQRIFLMKCIVNNIEYQPSIGSNNKKLAKATAAQVCLESLGILPS